MKHLASLLLCCCILYSNLSISQNDLEKKGCLGLEVSTLLNQNNEESLYHNLGVGLNFEFNKLRFGGTMNFVLVERYQEIFTGGFAPAFEYQVAYRLLDTGPESTLHFGVRGGIRTGIFNYENYDGTSEIMVVPNLESTTYIGPAISLTKYIRPKVMQNGYLSLNFELNYMFAINAYNSNERVFSYKIDKNQAMLGDALHLKLMIGWGKDI